MTFVSIPLDTFPKRTRAPKEVDVEAGNALYDLIAEGGPEHAASDGLVYDAETQARTAARKATRVLSASPGFQASGMRARTRVGQPHGQDGWSYAIYLASPKADSEPAKKRGK